jgi:hypothetical protein
MIGTILFIFGLSALLYGLVDSNVIRIGVGLLLIVIGVSILFAANDLEAGRLTREVFYKLRAG